MAQYAEPTFTFKVRLFVLYVSFSGDNIMIVGDWLIVGLTQLVKEALGSGMGVGTGVC